MKESGALFASEEIVHSYPHCWRCKKPIIFRATPQLFCSVETFKDAACEACEEVRWVPAWGLERMKAMVAGVPRLVISRQRHLEACHPRLLLQRLRQAHRDRRDHPAHQRLFGAEGSNAWFAKGRRHLPAVLPPLQPQSSKLHQGGGHPGRLVRLGSSHFASMQKDQGFWPADVYMEGLDQYRGWFQAALLTAVGSTGVAKAPFKTCITHGWTVDGEGKAMHKSLGNGVDPYDIMNKYGADLIRLWAASADYHADMRCSEKIFKQLSQNYFSFATASTILGNLNGFDPDNLVAPADMLALDKWAITRLNALIQKCFQGYDDYDFNVVTHAVNDFCVVEMSNFYLDIIKDRLYCEGKDSLARRSAQTALYLILDTMTKIMAPVLCFTGDEIWQSMPHAAGVDGRNVVFNDMNQPFADYALSADEMAQWDKIIAVRDVVNGVLETARAEKKIGKSLEADIVLTVPAEDAFLAEMPAEALADLLIVSQVEVTVGDAIQASVKTAEGGKCQRCWKVLPTVNARATVPPLRQGHPVSGVDVSLQAQTCSLRPAEGPAAVLSMSPNKDREEGTVCLSHPRPVSWTWTWCGPSPSSARCSSTPPPWAGSTGPLARRRGRRISFGARCCGVLCCFSCAPGRCFWTLGATCPEDPVGQVYVFASPSPWSFGPRPIWSGGFGSKAT